MDFAQDITWYAASGSDGKGGSSFSSPLGIRGNWEQLQTLVRNAKGDTVVANNVVYVDRDVAIGDYIVLGTTTEPNPVTAGAVQIRDYSKIASVDGQEFLRKAIA